MRPLYRAGQRDTCTVRSQPVRYEAQECVIPYLLWGQVYVVISLMIRGDHDIQCMPCSSRIIKEMLPEIHKWKILISQIYNSV